MQLVEEIGLPELTNEQIEQLCTIAEDAARKLILSKIPNKSIERLDISIEAEGTKPVDLKVDVDLVLYPQTKTFNSDEIVKEAIKEAFKAGENFLSKLK